MLKQTSVFIKLINFFSTYTDSQERKVHRFFNRSSLSWAKRSVQTRLRQLMQEDMVRVNVYLEWRFKGYKRLHKYYRRTLYQNADIIREEFVSYFNQHFSAIKDALQYNDGLTEFPDVTDEKLIYLFGIMSYLKPGGIYEYNSQSAFEKILKNPTQEKLVGDCNQIVTLYIFLYALKYPLEDIKVKLLPKHVCLHYRGIDIETTNGQFTKYDKFDYLSGIEEIVATNLLDVADVSQKQYNLTPETMLKSAEFAFMLSSHRDIVERNLEAAYNNLAVKFLENNNFDKAEQFFLKMKDAKQGLKALYNNAVIYYVKRKDFNHANKFAQKSRNQDLIRYSAQSEAADMLQKKNYSTAVRLYQKINDQKGEEICYQNEMIDLYKKVQNFRTVEQLRPYKSTLKKIEGLAKKINNQEMINYCREVLGKL